MSDIDVDALYDQAMSEGDHSSIPMTGDETTTQETVVPPVAAAPTVPDFEFNHNGKQVKVKWDDPRVKQWLPQGYDYSLKMSDLKKQQEEITLQQEKYKPYKEINEWAEKNPDTWQTLVNDWRTKTAQAEASGQVAPQVPKEILEKIQEQDKFLAELKQERQQAAIQKEDSALEAEIKSIREKYTNLDFDAPSHDGQSLEYRVMEHGVKNSIKSFKTAFNDYYHENLLKLAEEKGKETVSKDIQKKQKLGLLGKTQAPTKGLTSPRDVRNSSYDDLLKEAMTEYNVS